MNDNNSKSMFLLNLIAETTVPIISYYDKVLQNSDS